MNDRDSKAFDGEPASFGRFNVTGVLGRGGMGVVYVAQDPIIGRRVAIKVLRPDPALNDTERAELQSRFEQEFRSAGTLSHPNVVTVYDVGRGEDEAAFMAMECVEGQSLAELISSGKVLSFKEISDLALQLSSALDYAHQAEIVHRDIKPGNVLIDRSGRPKITDFGVAKVLSANLTRTGTVIGTPSYMSPEQVTGQPVTGASDQWAVAVILYQMLTGELPFAGENPTTILYKIVHQDPIGPHQLNRSLPPEVDAVLLRALRKNPRERFASCSEFAVALGAALGATPMIPAEITARTVTLTQSDLGGGSDTYGGASSWWQRQKTGPRIGLLAAAAALVAALGWFSMSFLAAPDANPGNEGTEDVEPPPPPADRWSGELSVSSNGSGGAQIWVNGSASGLETPATLELAGRPGDTVRLELKRYSQTVAAADLELGDGLPPQWRPRETPLPREVYTITSRPEGATVTVNGKELDTNTPVEVEFAYGERYNVFVSLAGHEQKSWGFLFPDDLSQSHLESRRLQFNLASSAPPGTVAVNAPYEVILEAGGRRVGPSTQPRLELPEGDYDVTISAPSVYLRRERPGVRIASGETFELPPLPEARTIRVASYPGNARVYIDGEFAGDVPFDVTITLGPHNFLFSFPNGDESHLEHFRVSRSTTQVFGEAPK